MSWLNKLLRKIPIIKTKLKPQDNRSQRFVAVIDCIMNQNTRDAGASVSPAMNWKVLQLCNQYDVGILQMPCPEIAFLGFPRTRPPGMSIRAALDTSNGRACCRKLSHDIVDRVEELILHDAHFLAVLGGNPQSPGCAVPTDKNDKQKPSGVLISQLSAELKIRGISIPIRGIRDFDASLMSKDIEWLQQLFEKNYN